MVRNRLTAEGELIPMCQYPLSLDNETSPVDDIFLFMVWPVTVVHTIDQSSPLWDISADQLITEQFEIIVILEGTVESTGSSTQVRTSYLPSEIAWGQRLAPLMTYHKENGCYTIDYKRFHDTLPLSMPDFSAKCWSTRCTSWIQSPSAGNYHAEFTTSLFGSVPRERHIISKIFRNRTVSAPGVQRQVKTLQTQKEDEADASLAWTLTDPLRPEATLIRRSSQLWIDVELTDRSIATSPRRDSGKGFFSKTRAKMTLCTTLA